MKTLSSLAQTVATKALRSSRPLLPALAACVLSLGLAATAQAAPITGTPQTNTFGWVPNSTNALNYAKQTPSYIGEDTPYVLFNSNAVGSVTLDFFGPYAGISFFETRIDGIATGTVAHPVVIGDTEHLGGTFVPQSDSVLGKTFSATNYVDIRLALGGERGFDFDWVRFEVLPAEVPLPAAAYLFGSALIGLGVIKRKRS